MPFFVQLTSHVVCVWQGAALETEKEHVRVMEVASAGMAIALEKARKDLQSQIDAVCPPTCLRNDLSNTDLANCHIQRRHVASCAIFRLQLVNSNFT